MSGRDLPFDPDGLASPDLRARKASVEGAIAALGALESGARRRSAVRLLDELAAATEPHVRGAWLEVAAAFPEEVGALVAQRIGCGGAEERVFVDLLQRVGTSRHADLLAGIAGDPHADTNVRASAAEALGAIGGPVAEGALLRLLDAPDELLRTYALAGLAAMGACVPPDRLDSLLASPVTRRAALAAAAHGRPEHLLGRVLTHLLDRMAGVRVQAAVTASLLARRLDEDGRGWAALDALQRLCDEARAVLRGLLRHPDLSVVRSAAHLVALAGDRQALEALLPMAEDPEVAAHAQALVAGLGSAASSALSEVLARAEATHRKVVFRLARAVPRDAVAEPDFVQQLAAALEDEDDETAAAAAEALCATGGRSALGPLYRAMGREGLVGEQAADALADLLAGTVRHTEDLDVLVGARWPSDGPLARNLCRVVARLGRPQYVQNLVGMLGAPDATVRVAAASALGRIDGDHEGVGALAFALADEDAFVRAAACRSLGRLGVPEGIGPLLGATRDSSPAVRAAAVQALSDLGNPVIFPRLREILYEDPAPAVVVQAIIGLGRSRSVHDTSLLLGLTTAQDHEVLKAAARALAAAPGHRVTAALLGLLDHERWDVRWAAAEVLGTRGDATAAEPLARYLTRERDDLVRTALSDALARLRAVGGEVP